MGKKRTANLFLKQLTALLEPRLSADTRLHPFIDTLQRARKAGLGKSPKRRDEDGAAARTALDTMVAGSVRAGETIRDMLGDVAPALDWYDCYPDHPDPALARALVAAHVVGSLGIVRHPEALAGLFFIDANIDYPLHDHRSNELYVVLSGDVDIALGFGTDTVSHAPGSYAVVPPGTPHQLRTGSKPVLLAFIWTGEIKCPVHWWHEAEPGVWQRTLPPRAMYDASTEEMVGAQDILPTGLDHPNLGNAPPYPTRRPS